MSLSDVMTREFIVRVKPSTPVKEVAKLMYENGVGSVLVVDNNDKLLGIFTERDLVRLVAQEEDLSKPVEHFMTRKVFTLRPDEDLWKALDMMVELGVRHVPVVDAEGKVMGIVSMRDLLNRLRVSDS